MNFSPEKLTLSIVMPVFNEAQDIQQAVNEICEHILPLIPDSQLIIVDDGSTDGTGPLLDRIAASESRLQILHGPNRGHGSALIRGVDAATGDFVFVLDSDRQIPVHAFADLWLQTKSADAVFGVRRNRRDPLLRIALAKCIRAIVRVLFGVYLKDPNCPFKLFKRSLWTEFRAIVSQDVLAPSLFFAIFTKRSETSLLEIPIPHRARFHGESKIIHLKLLRFCIRAFVQLLGFRKQLG